MRAIVILPAADQDRANATVAAEFDNGGSGHLTFSNGLVPIGSPEGTTPTHYWCAALFSHENWVKLPAIRMLFPGAVVEEWDIDAQPGKPDALLAELGLQRPVISMP